MLRVDPPRAPAADRPGILAHSKPTYSQSRRISAKTTITRTADRAAGTILPVPPRDNEKFKYVRRNTCILTLFSVSSFLLLLKILCRASSPVTARTRPARRNHEDRGLPSRKPNEPSVTRRTQFRLLYPR